MSAGTRAWSDQWQRLRRALSGAELDPEALDQALRAAVRDQPVPVLWLLGSAQSGKTSIVRALTGSSTAEIGNGFKPCTRSARLYDFPPEAPVVRFLDTRGLGEVDYDPGPDLAQCENRSHLVIAVVRVSDARPAAIARVLADLRRRHPDWPLLIAQTTLHQAYPDEAEHVQPYPFQAADWNKRVPETLARLILAQREFLNHQISGPGGVFWVPLDFTQPEDGYQPTDYGLDALWSAIEEASTMGLQARLRADPEIADAFARVAHPQIVGYSLAAAAVGALPLVDMAAVPAIQARLLQVLGSLYHRPWDRRRTAEFLGLLGGSIVGFSGLRMAGRSLVKLVPVWGQTAGAIWGATSSGAVTYALGKAAGFYLYRSRSGHPVEAQNLRSVYAQALHQGRELIRSQRRERPS